MSMREKILARKWELAALAVILLFGIFLRTYHFSDWLQFEIDQSYDTLIVSNAVQNGPASLPLLGPTAAGGRALRLGPAFYYLEYLSALVFGDNPSGHAMLVLLSSILSIPLFYIFSRRYFSAFLTLLLTAIYSSSLYLVMYGRFSWSPNVLPFFILLTFYALLRSVSNEEKHRSVWFLIFAASFSIITQIHFNAFFIVPAVVITFLLFRRPRFNWKTWLAAGGIFLLIYSPLILNETKTRGEDLGFFTKKVSKIQGAHNYLSSFREDTDFFSMESFLVMTGQDEFNGKSGERETINHFPGAFWNGPVIPVAGALIFLTLFYALLLALIRQKEKAPDQRAFIQLVFLWFLFSFLYFLTLAHSHYRLYPRFFLMLAPLVFVMLGLALDFFDTAENKNWRLMTLLIAAVFFTLNFSNDLRVFAAYQKGMSAPQELETEDIFPNTNRLTLLQQKEVVQYIRSVYEKNHYSVYLQSLHEYEPIFWYHLEKLGIKYYAPLPADHLYREGNYFNIYPSSEEKGTGHAYDAADQKVFGSITVDRWTPKDKYITQERQSDSTREKTDQMKNIDALETWATVLK